MKVLAVDWFSLFRAQWEGARENQIQVAGPRTVNAITSLWRKEREVPIDRCVVCIDRGKSMRLAIDPDYKRGRPVLDDAFYTQSDLALDDLARKGAFIAAPIPTAKDPDLSPEADDLIAGLVQYCKRQQIDVVMWSRDGDLDQLLDVNVRRYDGKTLLTAEWAAGHYGVHPGAIPALKALAGDTSDGYKPFPGIGPKTAAEFLQWCLTNAHDPLEVIREIECTADLLLPERWRQLTPGILNAAQLKALAGALPEQIASQNVWKGGKDAYARAYALALLQPVDQVEEWVSHMRFGWSYALRDPTEIASIVPLRPQYGEDLPDMENDDELPGVAPGAPEPSIVGGGLVPDDVDGDVPSKDASRPNGMVVESNALVIVDGTSRMLVSPSEARQRLREFQALLRSVMVRGVDFGKIPGCGDKDVLHKSGAEKLAEVYGLAPSFREEKVVEDWDLPLFYYKIRCVLSRRSDGVTVAECIGSANSKETKWAGRWAYRGQVPQHIDPSTLKQRRIRAKGGEDIVQFRVPNEEIFDQVNAILKIAQKRAMVGAVLLATRASGVFAADLEEMAPGDYGSVLSVPQWAGDAG